MIIYMVTNKINQKRYIGQTIKDLETRKGAHISRASHNKSNNYFHSAILKYGSKNFDWKILDKCDNIKVLNSLEIFYIGYYDTFEKGYNLTCGGGGSPGCKPSAETRKKISIANIGKRTGYKQSVEARRKISVAKTGKKHPCYGKHHSIKTKKKMSEAQIGEKNHNYGKKTSPETKRKLSKASSGKNNPSAVAIIIGDKHFDTRKEAAQFIGMSPAGIRVRILHKTKWLDYRYA